MNATLALRSAAHIRPRNVAKVAGFAYVGAWVVGLAAFGAGPAADATDAELTRYFADHRVMSAIQSLLVHGVAAVALLVVVAAVHRDGRSSRAGHAAGLAAVALSLVQCGLGVYRSVVSTGSTTATLVHAIDRIDGVKMFALAAMIAASIRPFRAAGMIGPRMTALGRVGVVSLVVSGVAYAGHVTGLLESAVLSLVLLVAWVAHTGVAVDRAGR